MPPPSVPPGVPATDARRLPGWVWGLVALGGLMAVAGAGVLYLAVQEAQSLQMGTERPKRGVPLTGPDEQLSVGGPGEFVYTHRDTGAVRRVFNEGREAQAPEWLRVPEEFRRVTATARRGSGRREASFQFTGQWSVEETVRHFSRVLTAGGLRVRVTEARFADSIVAGEDARREAFVHIAKQGGGVRVMAVITEPAE